VGDILLQIDDMPMDDIEALRWAVGSKAPGERVKVLYLRDGIEHEMEIELGPSGRRHRRSL
jgi:putative serine protease PepD